MALSGGKELTTVENELDHVRQYLFIQQERYGDQLAYDIVCDDALVQMQMPKILVQPIVENALYHGIRGIARQGHIEIRAEVSASDILLIVKDNGDPFDLAQIDQNVSNNVAKLGGVGIKNVDERIKLYYGEEYGITIDSIVGSGMTVTIKIPQNCGQLNV